MIAAPETSALNTAATGRELTTWSGFCFRVRPVAPEDKAALADFFAKVSPEDRRFRFLSAVRKVDQDLLKRLTEVDHERTEDFLAYDGDTLVGSAMLAADAAGERAEIAVSIRADYKNRGIGWALLEHATHYAANKGIRIIESIESRDNVEAISLEKEIGFAATPCPGEPTLLLLQKTLE